MKGNCKAESLVYRATVNRGDIETEESYSGSTAGSFKIRYTGHMASLRHREKSASTTLSKYVWSLKDKGIAYTINWDIVCQAPAYNPAYKRCMLCLMEKHTIMYHRNWASLNSRAEISATCRHKTKFLLG